MLIKSFLCDTQMPLEGFDYNSDYLQSLHLKVINSRDAIIHFRNTCNIKNKNLNHATSMLIPKFLSFKTFF